MGGGGMTLRGASLVAAAYFAVVWWLLAQQHRVLGAFIVFVIGAVAAWVATRSRRAPDVEPASVSAPIIPTPSAIDYAADPELPEHRRARFLGALGHELRNPLNSVTGFSDMLLGGVDGPLNAEQERSVRTIRASAERLLRLVSTIVDQAKLEAGTMRLRQQWVAPHELVAEMLQFTRSRLESTSVMGGVSDGLPGVFVDRHRTVQALVSLAVLVIRSSDTDISIRVAPPRRDQSGKGFVQFDLMASLNDASADTLAIVEKLERPLSRSDALGLEVAVARSVIEAQGGRIWTEAGTAGSLRVCVTLPTSANQSSEPSSSTTV